MTVSDDRTFEEHTVSTYEGARDVFRQKDLRQALYDAGEVVMADVLVNLHGEDHRARRRKENRLFRKDTVRRYENELFPPIVSETLAPHVEAGRAELVSLSHQMMMNLSAFTAGVDRPKGTPEETFHLYNYLMLFIEGATLAHYTGDREAKEAEVATALGAFDEEFLQPSVERRMGLIAGVEAGTTDEGDLPKDVLTTLLTNSEELHLPDDVLLRETCFYLLAGAHTSATAFVRTLNNVFSHAEELGGLSELAEDRGLLQRCVHETVRLQPSSPVAMRWALAQAELADGTMVAKGDRVVVDLNSANRDPEIFGDNADEFDPMRELPTGVALWGLSFGLGMHACIGQYLAAGYEVFGESTDTERLYGLVPEAIQAFLRAGGRADPSRPPVIDPESERGYWSEYPVTFPVTP